MRFAEGCVVALRRGGRGVVWRIAGRDLWVVPIGGCNGPSRHRAEVRIERTDAVMMGVAIKYPAALCQNVRKVGVSELDQPMPVGQAPAQLVQAIGLAILRDVRARASEERLQYCRARPDHDARMGVL